MSLSKRELEIDDTVRRALVAWEDDPRFSYPITNWRRSGLTHHIRQAVAALLALPEPTLDEVVASMRENGGIMRTGDYGSLPDGRLVEPSMLAAVREALDD